MTISIKLKELSETLDTLSKDRGTGNLIIRNNELEGNLHLVSGRLLYATSWSHPVRRLHRALKQHCPKWVPDTSQLDDENLWEYQLLYQGIRKKQLSVQQAKAVIRTIVREVFFDIGYCKDCNYQWVGEDQESDTQISLSLALSYLEVEPALTKAIEMQQQWHNAGLSKISPTLAPVLKQGVKPEAVGGFGKFLTGKLTLWDIALKLRKSVYAVTRALIPLAKKKLVQFRTIPDLAKPKIKKPVTTASSKPDQPEANQTKVNQKQLLIACMDDSPVVAETLRKILEPAGYKILSIQEPMRGIAQLIEHKPDLIFLDLMMPNANGYSVCKFLRQTSVFDKTPIIVLTSRDTLIERNRVKLVGASDFLGKPPEKEKTLELVQKYLKPVQNEGVEPQEISGGMPRLAIQ
ncbi:MAG: response regulator [Moorea sp. SIO2B7]|nr:response regulator [Moorena sp. SIO2B7]